MANSPSHFTIAQIAERWHASHSHVLSLVQSGKLRAIDISSNPAGRSHYIIPAESLEDFEEARTVRVSAPTRRRSRSGGRLSHVESIIE